MSVHSPQLDENIIFGYFSCHCSDISLNYYCSMSIRCNKEEKRKCLIVERNTDKGESKEVDRRVRIHDSMADDQNAPISPISLTSKISKFKIDLQRGSLTNQVAGEHQPSYKHP